MLALNDFLDTVDTLINIDDFDFSDLSAIAALETEIMEDVMECHNKFIHYSDTRGNAWRQLQQ